jgi:enamine deaminase RidA (YjgF/YER057c/UK114 family)
MTWYVKGLDAYRDNMSEVGRAWRDIMGKNYPTMAVIGVTDLVETAALIEIETTAVIPH